MLRCDAGADHGLGHLVRCRSLAGALGKAGTREIAFVSSAAPSMLAAMLGTRGFRYRVSPHPIGSPSDGENLRQQLARERGTHTVVLDARAFGEGYVQKLSEWADVVCLDDEQYRDLGCRLIVNPNPWADPQRYGVRPGRSVVTGPKRALVDPAFAKIRRDRNTLGEPPTVMITMGGEDPDNVTAQAIGALAALPQHLRLVAVLGPAFRGQSPVREAIGASPHHVTVVEGRNDLTGVMEMADAAISSASTTCYELATAGVPTILIALADHQFPVARYFRDSRCGVVLGAGDDLAFSPAPLCAAVAQMLADKDDRHALQRRATTLFDGMGAARIAEAILDGAPAGRGN